MYQNQVHQEETPGPTHRFRRLYVNQLLMGWRGYNDTGDNSNDYNNDDNDNAKKNNDDNNNDSNNNDNNNNNNRDYNKIMMLKKNTLPTGIGTMHKQ